MSETIHELLATGESDAPAIGAPGREPLTYAALRADVQRLAAQLRALGIGRNDRVGIVLPNGPEMAVTFL
ncbi:MAG: AMP-binding protein, partial [Dehalococcoidia bacterium]